MARKLREIVLNVLTERGLRRVIEAFSHAFDTLEGLGDATDSLLLLLENGIRLSTSGEVSAIGNIFARAKRATGQHGAVLVEPEIIFWQIGIGSYDPPDQPIRYVRDAIVIMPEPGPRETAEALLEITRLRDRQGFEVRCYAQNDCTYAVTDNMLTLLDTSKSQIISEGKYFVPANRKDNSIFSGVRVVRYRLYD